MKDGWSPTTDKWAVSAWNRRGIEASPAFVTPPKVADCTLRDGEQQAGVVFSPEDKVILAVMLNNLGVHDIEVGTPAVSEDDRRAAEEIARLGLRSEISAVSRATRADIDLVAACGVETVRISFPISARQQDAKLHIGDSEYVPRALEMASYAKSRGLGVVFSPYDTTRCDLNRLRELLQAFARENCVDRVRMVDTVGAATPEAVDFLVRFMIDAGSGIPIEVHCHDDFGLATANTVAGVLAGAAYLSTTVTGIGERSGNAALEEVVMALRVLYGIDVGLRTELLSQIAADVEKRSGVQLQAHKPIVGHNSFVHESGMVVAGVLKDPFTAEAYAPDIVGQVRSIVLGKKSGAASVRLKLTEMQVGASDESVDQILAHVKARSIELKRGLSTEEFREIAQQVLL